MENIVKVIEDILKNKKNEYELLSERGKEVEDEYCDTIKKINDEMLRLQGEYRALNNLIEKINEKDDVKVTE